MTWLGCQLLKQGGTTSCVALVLAEWQRFLLVQQRSTTMLPNRYQFRDVKSRLAQLWADTNIYAFNPQGSGPLYTIDTPPPTVSGELHLGHCYSYTQTDVIAPFSSYEWQTRFISDGI